MSVVKPTTVAEYIEAAPTVAQAHLRELRGLLKELAPDATESLKWGSPVFEEARILFSYSAHKTHVNFVPAGPSLEPFREKLTGYKTGKDSVQFPYDKPLPQELIQTIAAHRLEDVRENDARWMY